MIQKTLVFLSVLYVWPAIVFGADETPAKNNDRPTCSSVTFRVRGDLQLRKVGGNDDGLLITRKPSSGEKGIEKDVYKYDPNTKKVDAVESRAWEEAQGVVTHFNMWGPPMRPERIIVDNFKLYRWKFSGNRPREQMPTRGKYVLRTKPSTTGKWLAVLTSDGGDGEKPNQKLGQHYVEVFSWPKTKLPGLAFPIPYTEADVIDPLCWSQDDTYLVVAPYRRPGFCVIEVLSGEDTKNSEK